MVAYSFKERFIWPIQIGLGSAVPDSFGMPVPKRQTIRAVGKRRHARPGENLQLYYGMRTKHCRSIGVARCTKVTPVRIVVRDEFMTVYVGGKHVNGAALNEFAKADGFETAKHMHHFWQAEHGLGIFTGQIIEWEPLT